MEEALLLYAQFLKEFPKDPMDKDPRIIVHFQSEVIDNVLLALFLPNYCVGSKGTLTISHSLGDIGLRVHQWFKQKDALIRAIYSNTIYDILRTGAKGHVVTFTLDPMYVEEYNYLRGTTR